MIRDEEQVEFFQNTAREQFLWIAIKKFGEDACEKVIRLTEGITQIYKHLNYNSFEEVIIGISMDNKRIVDLFDSNLVSNIISINAFGTKSGNRIFIELIGDNSFSVIIDGDISIDSIKDKGIVYSYTRTNDEENFYIKDSTTKLRSIPGADTYFSIQTFKDLDVALEQYSIKRAKYSECSFLKATWLTDERVFLKPGPEDKLRDSLADFLTITFRAEVRPEQIVDTSHPVDIKITWPTVNRVALIEIKWLGKSLLSLGDRFTANYTDVRARGGAKQLAEYLDSNKVQIPDKNTKGYLVVFDCRRRNTNTNTERIDAQNGMYYRNREVTYNPKFDEIREDFAKPIRFFMEPRISVYGQ